ncbi:hypothetical protein FQR65_LT16357 [Abscondita terminalis]|nr:hypothetical protein FQR65_LT16357 [Abscondita terminalis]
MGYKLKVKYLSHNELRYEILIRGGDASLGVSALPVLLKNFIAEEAAGNTTTCVVYPFCFDADKTAINEGIDELKGLIDLLKTASSSKIYVPSENNDSEVKEEFYKKVVFLISQYELLDKQLVVSTPCSSGINVSVVDPTDNTTVPVIYIGELGNRLENARSESAKSVSKNKLSGDENKKRKAERDNKEAIKIAKLRKITQFFNSQISYASDYDSSGPGTHNNNSKGDNSDKLATSSSTSYNLENGNEESLNLINDTFLEQPPPSESSFPLTTTTTSACPHSPQDNLKGRN